MMIVKYNNKVVSNNGKWVCYISSPGPGPEPGTLPANTIRLKFSAGYIPEMGDSQTLVDAQTNVWDIYISDNNWNYLFSSNEQLLEILGANTSNITNMNNTFGACTNLTYISIFDTSNVTDMSYMFYWCTAVESGALALYNQASTQTNPPSNHFMTFNNCGINTQTGTAELSQIPTSWGGTMEE